MDHLQKVDSLFKVLEYNGSLGEISKKPTGASVAGVDGWLGTGERRRGGKRGIRKLPCQNEGYTN